MNLLRDAHNIAASENSLFAEALAEDDALRARCPYHVPLSLRNLLATQGIGTSHRSVIQHDHPANYAIGACMTDLCVRKIQRPCTAIQMKTSKYLLSAKTNPNIVANEQLTLTHLDKVRFPKATKRLLDTINTPCALLHEVMQYLTPADVAELFKRSPNLEELYAVAIIPPELLYGDEPFWPDLYRLVDAQDEDENVFYVPENHFAGAYLQPQSAKQWFSINEIHGLGLELSCTLVESRFAHHIFHFARGNGLAQTHRLINCPDAVVIPELQSGCTLAQRTVSRKIGRKIVDYGLFMKNLDYNHVGNRIRAFLQDDRIEMSTATEVAATNLVLAIARTNIPIAAARPPAVTPLQWLLEKGLGACGNPDLAAHRLVLQNYIQSVTVATRNNLIKCVPEHLHARSPTTTFTTGKLPPTSEAALQRITLTILTGDYTVQYSPPSGCSPGVTPTRPRYFLRTLLALLGSTSVVLGIVYAPGLAGTLGTLLTNIARWALDNPVPALCSLAAAPRVIKKLVEWAPIAYSVFEWHFDTLVGEYAEPVLARLWDSMPTELQQVCCKIQLALYRSLEPAPAPPSVPVTTTPLTDPQGATPPATSVTTTPTIDPQVSTSSLFATQQAPVDNTDINTDATALQSVDTTGTTPATPVAAEPGIPPETKALPANPEPQTHVLPTELNVSLHSLTPPAAHVSVPVQNSRSTSIVRNTNATFSYARVTKPGLLDLTDELGLTGEGESCLVINCPEHLCPVFTAINTQIRLATITSLAQFPGLLLGREVYDTIIVFPCPTQTQMSVEWVNLMRLAIRNVKVGGALAGLCPKPCPSVAQFFSTLHDNGAEPVIYLEHRPQPSPHHYVICHPVATPLRNTLELDETYIDFSGKILNYTTGATVTAPQGASVPFPTTDYCLIQAFATALQVPREHVWAQLTTAIPAPEANALSRNPRPLNVRHLEVIAAAYQVRVNISAGKAWPKGYPKVYGAAHNNSIVLSWSPDGKGHWEAKGPKLTALATPQLPQDILARSINGSYSTYTATTQRYDTYAKELGSGLVGTVRRQDAGKAERIKALADLPMSRQVQVSVRLGTFGSGKTHPLCEAAASLLKTNRRATTFIAPRKALRNAIKRKLRLAPGMGKCAQTFETPLVHGCANVVVLDEIGLYPPGYVDLLVTLNPNITHVLLVGDPAQCDYYTPVAESDLNTLPSEIDQFKHMATGYLLKTRRLAVGVARSLGIPTTSTAPGNIRALKGLPQHHLPYLVPSDKARLRALESGYKEVYTYRGSQGQDFDGPYTVCLDANSDQEDARHLLVALTRGKSDVYINNLVPTNCSLHPNSLAAAVVNGQPLQEQVANIFRKHVPNFLFRPTA